MAKIETVHTIEIKFSELKEVLYSYYHGTELGKFDFLSSDISGMTDMTGIRVRTLKKWEE